MAPSYRVGGCRVQLAQAFFVNPPVSVAKRDSREQEVLLKAGETQREAPCGCVAHRDPSVRPTLGHPKAQEGTPWNAQGKVKPGILLPREEHPLRKHPWGSPPPPHSPPSPNQ